MVFSLSVLLGIILPNIYRLGHRSVENCTKYASEAQAHDLAASGANVALNQFYFNTTWRSGYNEVHLAGGKYSVSIQDYGTNKVKIVSVGSFEKSADTVSVLLQPTSFAHYAYYSKTEGNIFWVTGDTVWGPFHTQDSMKISGTPVFKGRVSAKLGTHPKNSGAQFDGGFISGENIDLPLDFHEAENAASSGSSLFPSGDLWLTMNGSSVEWKTSATGSPTVTPLSTFAPNGIIMVSNGNIYLKGTLSGKLTICAEGSSSQGLGNIYIEDDVKYSVDPRTQTSYDLLGLLAENSVIITDNTANNNSVVLQASIMCRTGGLTAEHHSTRGVSGTLNLLGGIIQSQRGPVGVFSGGTYGQPVITSGFRKNYKYDNRLYLESPLLFPNTGKYQVVSWVE